jgi:hypothetical protein
MLTMLMTMVKVVVIPGLPAVNLHFHMLFLDGVHVDGPDASLTFRWVTGGRALECVPRVSWQERVAC